MNNLESLISAALSDNNVASAHVAELLTATEAGIAQADKDAENARTRALDPVLSPDPKAARQAMEDAVFASARLKTLLPRLQRLFTQLQHAEDKARWTEIYNQLIPRRDALSAELKALYTEFAPKLVGILQRTAKLDREIKRAKQVKPVSRADEPYEAHELTDVEAHARGFTHLGGEHLLTLAKSMILPDWENPTKRVWPPYPEALELDPAEQALESEAWHTARDNAAKSQRESYERQQQQPQTSPNHLRSDSRSIIKISTVSGDMTSSNCAASSKSNSVRAGPLSPGSLRSVRTGAPECTYSFTQVPRTNSSGRHHPSVLCHAEVEAEVDQPGRVHNNSGMPRGPLVLPCGCAGPGHRLPKVWTSSLTLGSGTRSVLTPP